MYAVAFLTLALNKKKKKINKLVNKILIKGQQWCKNTFDKKLFISF